MTITLTKTKLALAVLAVAMLVPATALATHVFSDVPDGAFYADPVDWAFNNSITTGKSATSFAPLDDVTRGESVTFLKRYDDNIVQPALTTLTGDVATNTTDIATNTTDIATNTADIATNTADIAANTIGLFSSDARFAATTVLGDLGLSASVTIPPGRTGVIEIGYTAESACYGGLGAGWCKITLLVDGSAVGDSDFAFDSTDSATESSSSWEGHAMTRVSADLPAGTYVITAVSSLGNSTPTFRLDDMVLTAEVHLTS